MTPDRERDESGRPRNARPRDALGRPLPRGDAGVVRVPDDLVLPPHESLREAQRLLDEGRPFHAHEVLEATWKAAPADERDLWQGLAQLAVGLTHALRRNNVGAAALLRRGAGRISGYAERRPYGIDVAGLLDWARTLAAQLDDRSEGGDPPSAPRLLGTRGAPEAATRLEGMSAISRDDVAHLAMLARIDLSDAELDKMSGELAVILESVARVSEVAADDVPPMSHPLPLTNVTRPDVVRPSLTAKEALAGAPAAEQQRFSVPRILDED